MQPQCAAVFALSSGRTPPLGPSLRRKKERPLGTVLKESSVSPDPLPHIRHRSPIAVPVPDLHNPPDVSIHDRRPEPPRPAAAHSQRHPSTQRRRKRQRTATQQRRRCAAACQTRSSTETQGAGTNRKQEGIRVAHGRPGQQPGRTRPTDRDAKQGSRGHRLRCEVGIRVARGRLADNNR